MVAIRVKEACHEFAEVAASFLCIDDEQGYEQALELVEELLVEAEDSCEDPINAIIELLARAIETYENQQEELLDFERAAVEGDRGLAILRVLMDQYQLGVSDLPEIGSKSMVSRVLSGERQLNRNHIQALSTRFNVSPALFFQ
ncbi:hypothetical protein [uncultured Pseudoteredinibacter sp.]|uniref:helix-turn-helix domain-containing protein n=1 Tax=uncultured Pseudoteredinibacter sp. TaxID=1641701 RepID=UPI0026337A75|nr:hypothetical protein [uncultured Pseudoteredinibacter sp.]